MGNCKDCEICSVGLFQYLSAKELAEVDKTKKIVKFKKGETIFCEGKSINGVYCIEDGICKLIKTNSNGKETILKLTKKGEIVGLRSLITEDVSYLTAIALVDMNVCFIPKDTIDKILKNNHKFAFQLTKNICQLLKEANYFAASHTHKTVKERLAYVLLHLVSVVGINDEGFLELQLNREELANIAGTATENCIRQLSEFKKMGYVDLVGKKIKILNLSELEKICH